MSQGDTDIRPYPAELRSLFLGWCEDTAAIEPLPVLIGALVYAVGLHPQALPYARLECAASLAISYPRLIRRGDLLAADWLPGSLQQPDWLARAAETFLRAQLRRDGQLLIPNRDRLAQIPEEPVYLAQLLVDATLKGIGAGLSPAGLWATRIADAVEVGEPLVPYAAGYAPSYSGRLLHARRKARYVRTRTVAR